MPKALRLFRLRRERQRPNCGRPGKGTRDHSRRKFEDAARSSTKHSSCIDSAKTLTLLLIYFLLAIIGSSLVNDHAYRGLQ